MDEPEVKGQPPTLASFHHKEFFLPLQIPIKSFRFIFGVYPFDAQQKHICWKENILIEKHAAFFYKVHTKVCTYTILHTNLPGAKYLWRINLLLLSRELSTIVESVIWVWGAKVSAQWVIFLDFQGTYFAKKSS